MKGKGKKKLLDMRVFKVFLQLDLSCSRQEYRLLGKYMGYARCSLLLKPQVGCPGSEEGAGVMAHQAPHNR